MDIFVFCLLLDVFAAITTTEAVSTCKDLENDCADYGFDYICTGDFIPWSTIHCKKFCGLCEEVPACEDKVTDCADYGFDYICTGDYIPWSMINCRKYCGLCDTTSATQNHTSVTTPALTTVTTPARTTVTQTTPDPSGLIPCVDVDPDCADYGFDYICQGDYIPWSELHCAKFCNLCTDVWNPSGQVPCVDVDPDCADYGFDYICHGDYIPWSKLHCAKFCNLCTAQVAATDYPNTSESTSTSAHNTPEQTTTVAQAATTSDPTSAIAQNTPAPTTVVDSSGLIPCVDVDPDCDDYGFDYICKGDYIPWSELHCAKFCNLCTAQAATTVVPSTTESTIAQSTPEQTTIVDPSGLVPCVDVDPDCADYGFDYICKGDYIPWSELHCAKFCYLCTAQAATTVVQSSSESTSTIAQNTLDQATIVEQSTTTVVPSTSDTTSTIVQNTPEQTTIVDSSGHGVPCVDVDPDCAEYGFDYICHGDYIPWSKVHCAKFCNLCTAQAATTVVPSTSESTSTVGQNTPEQTTIGAQAATTFVPSTSESKSTVGQNTPEQTTIVDSSENVPCVDIDPDCADYGFDYICYGDYIPWSELHCAKFCNLCTAQAATTFVPSTSESKSTVGQNTPEQTTIVESTSITTQKTPEQTTFNGTGQEACVDLDLDCHEYGFDYICHGDYIPWSKIHCANYCNLCTDSSELVPCVDVDPDCADYGFDYICYGDYLPWSKLHCAKFCNLCTADVSTTTVPVTTELTTDRQLTSEEPVTASPHCVDLDSDCHEYGNDYICQGDYIPWSMIHCNKTCNFCHECIDKDADCADYGSDYICNGDYLPWAEIHCAKYCNICQGTSPLPSTTQTITSPIKVTSTTMKPATTEPSTTMKPATTEPSTTMKPATTEPATTMKPATTEPSTTMKPATTEPATTMKPATTEPSTTMKPVTTEPLTTIEVSTTAAPPFTLKPTKTESPTTTMKPKNVTATHGTTILSLITTNRPTKQSTTVIPLTTIKPTKQSTTESSLGTEELTKTESTTTIKPVKPESTITWKPTTTEPTSTMKPTTTNPTTTTKPTTIETMTRPPSESCGNKLPDCTSYDMTVCTDPKQIVWMWDNCRAHCKLCLQSRPCEDVLGDCETFKEFICTDPTEKLNCKVTCGLC